MDSILSQKTGYTFFVSLVNDGSTDKTPELLERYRADPRVEILTQSNRGLSGARNRALEHIRGKYILFVDSDDTLRKGAVEALLSKAVETNADIVQGGFVNITGHGLVFGRTGYREGSAAETGQTPYDYLIEKRIRLSENLLANPAMTISEIAALLNFTDQYHFSRIFKARNGIAPSVYRKKLVPKS